MPEHTLRPPPPTPIKQTAASRTRSRTSLAAKAAAGIAVPLESLSPASATGEEDELVKEMNEISCVVSITDTPNGMDISPDNSALQVKPPAASHLVDDFAMDVDKSEEIAVQEQLQLISPTVSELDHAQSSGGRPAVEYMDIETELADGQTDVVPSRYFSKGPGTTVITLDSQGQQIATTSITEAKPNGEADSDQEEDDVEGADDGPNPPQKFVNRILNTTILLS
jgi:hypothetical protein